MITGTDGQSWLDRMMELASAHPGAASGVVHFPASSPSAPHLVIGFAIHGNEYGTLPAACRLAEELSQAETEQAAERLERQVRQEWAKSGSATLDLLLKRGEDALPVLAEFCVMLDRFAKEASRLRYVECTINRSWDVCLFFGYFRATVVLVHLLSLWR